MIDDPNIEYEPNQEFDENGEPIFYIEKDYTADEFTSYNFNEEPPAYPLFLYLLYHIYYYLSTTIF